MIFDINLDRKAKEWDAKYCLRRPTNEQYLSSYKTLERRAQDWTRQTVCGLCCVVAIAFGGAAYLVLAGAGVTWGGALGWLPAFIALAAIGALLGDLSHLELPYSPYIRRETHGTARWAVRQDLQQAGVLARSPAAALLPQPAPHDGWGRRLWAKFGLAAEVKATPVRVPLAQFGRRHWLALPLDTLAQHVVVLGPPGCGKSASMFMNLARHFAPVGGMVALDVKGELYRHTAHSWRNVFRFDVDKPQHSDWLDLLSPCRDDATRAGKIASYMVNFDPNNGAKAKDPFWELSAYLMLKCLILHLCTLHEHPTPAEIFDFLAGHPCEAERPGPDGKTQTYNQLSEAMAASANPDARSEWGAAFGTCHPKTMSGVVLTMLTKLQSFRDPKVRQALRPPTPEETKQGRRRIDFHALRTAGTALYVVVKEGEAARLETVIATLFALANDVLVDTGDDQNACYCLLLLDEAGNVPFRNVAEGVGVGRGRKIIWMLGYQNFNQPEKQYGRADARAILEAVGAKFFLPGLLDETAAWASKMLGQTTALARTSRDAVADALDSESTNETGRALMNADELRQMLAFTQIVAVAHQMPPVRLRFPPNAKDSAVVVDPQDFTVINEELPAPVADVLLQDTASLLRALQTASQTPHEVIVDAELPPVALLPVLPQKVAKPEPPPISQPEPSASEPESLAPPQPQTPKRARRKATFFVPGETEDGGI